MSRYIVFFIVTFFAFGCTQLQQMQHLDELLTLKGYSDEKDAQQKWIEEENKKFQRLVAAVKDGSIQNYTGRAAVLKDFGSPVLNDMVEEKDQTLDRWLYRHPIQKFANERVYLYFNSDGNLVKFEHVLST